MSIYQKLKYIVIYRNLSTSPKLNITQARKHMDTCFEFQDTRSSDKLFNRTLSIYRDSGPGQEEQCDCRRSHSIIVALSIHFSDPAVWAPSSATYFESLNAAPWLARCSLRVLLSGYFLLPTPAHVLVKSRSFRPCVEIDVATSCPVAM